MFTTTTRISKRNMSICLHSCLRSQHFLKSTIVVCNSIVQARRTFFNSSSSSSSSSSSWSSSSSSFNFSAQPNGHSTNSNDLTNSIFKYNIAISYQPKDRDYEKGTLYQQTLAKLKSNISATGEDNFVVGVNTTTNSVIIGVADGVGGWSELGYDSAAISRELCQNLKESFEQESKPVVDTKNFLNLTFNKVIREGIVKVGGTTICFGVMNLKGQLTSTNLGDSWFGVFRPKEVTNSKDVRFECVYQSKDQTHGFNTPYQLSIIPKLLQLESAKQGKKYLQDQPTSADLYKDFQLQKNDIVLFATDGVTDNVGPEDISIYLSDEFNKRSNHVNEKALLNISKDLVGKVNAISQDPKFPSVFAQSLSKLINQKYVGGKYDDITIVMLHVI